jgi:hypothetical protein
MINLEKKLHNFIVSKKRETRSFLHIFFFVPRVLIHYEQVAGEVCLVLAKILPATFHYVSEENN